MATPHETVREDILDTIKQLKSGKIDPTMGLAIAANYKVYNDNVFAQVSSAKLALQIEDRAKKGSVDEPPTVSGTAQKLLLAGNKSKK